MIVPRTPIEMRAAWTPTERRARWTPIERRAPRTIAATLRAATNARGENAAAIKNCDLVPNFDMVSVSSAKQKREASSETDISEAEESV